MSARYLCGVGVVMTIAQNDLILIVDDCLVISLKL